MKLLSFICFLFGLGWLYIRIIDNWRESREYKHRWNAKYHDLEED
ncbi:MAG: hypothetical protein PHH77_10930 [Victivallaceae bacterium]|nr:hypothetical protein [Victivallaceae bacterium]